ncbi:MAG: stress responsive alpha-beta barrel domain-containing protein [Deltaproteobacteria bacterium HGW-Deltaproteobacteria-9]|nr:MAG: stress responsive alpha-beta barrel domain-containing protein [Deltaproteobacteria bacterium HGW-Deltaproteobacteria-9]
MLKHVVFMKFKPAVTATDIDQLNQALGGLPAAIAEIREFVFGQDIMRTERSWDFALVSAFDNMEAMNRYQVHPEHQIILQKVRAMCDSIVVVDFEF